MDTAFAYLSFSSCTILSSSTALLRYSNSEIACGCGSNYCKHPSTELDLPVCDTIDGNVGITADEDVTFNAQYITGYLQISVTPSHVKVSFPYLKTIGGDFYPDSAFDSAEVDIPYLTCIGGGSVGTNVYFPKLNLGMSGPGVTIGKDINFAQSSTSFANSKIIAINGSMYYTLGTAAFDWPYLKTLAGDVYITQTNGQGQINFQSIETIGSIFLTQFCQVDFINLQSVEKLYATSYAIYCDRSIDVYLPHNQTTGCDTPCGRVHCDNGAIPALTDECSFEYNSPSSKDDDVNNAIDVILVAGCAAAGAVLLIGAGGA